MMIAATVTNKVGTRRIWTQYYKYIGTRYNNTYLFSVKWCAFVFFVATIQSTERHVF